MTRKHNPIARDLRTPKYRKRVVRSKVKYDRKNTCNYHLDSEGWDDCSDGFEGICTVQKAKGYE